MLRTFLICIFAVLFTSVSSQAYSQSKDEIAQTVVHLLSYVAMDYSGAVENGEVIDEQEYIEQQEFSQRAFDLTNEGGFLAEEKKNEILKDLEKLIQNVNNKVEADIINKSCLSIINRVITLSGIQTAPKVWPSLANGKKLYAQNCAMCHGDKGYGDGIAGKKLEPAPSNFHVAEAMEGFSPFQAFNSIRLGVPETGMQAYTHLSIDEVWDLAFYVKSLRFSEYEKDSLELKLIFKEIALSVGLDKVAFMTDAQLSDTLKALGLNEDKGVIALRSFSPDNESYNSLPTAKKGLLAALKSYQKGDKKIALTHAINAYLEGIEPVEARLKTLDASFVGKIETQMFNVRRAIEKDLGEDVLKAEIDKAMDLIHEAQQMMTDSKMNYLVTFLLSMSIVLREALEAFLIIAIVISLIKSADVKKALVWLHGGWITAVALGILGWFLSDYIIQFGGRNREIMEGLVSLFAVVVLLIMGFWMHNQTHAAQWTKFVKERIGGLLNSERMFGLATFSFMVVFREAFEVILFLQAVNLEAVEGNKSAIGLGVITAAVAIAIIAYFFMKYTKNIPIRQLFKYSTWLLSVLAIILMGKGVHSLQESGWVSGTNISFMPRIEWLGVYPTWQSIISQVVLLLVIFIVIGMNNKRNAKKVEG